MAKGDKKSLTKLTKVKQGARLDKGKTSPQRDVNNMTKWSGLNKKDTADVRNRTILQRERVNYKYSGSTRTDSDPKARRDSVSLIKPGSKPLTPRNKRPYDGIADAAKSSTIGTGIGARLKTPTADKKLGSRQKTPPTNRQPRVGGHSN